MTAEAGAMNDMDDGITFEAKVVDEEGTGLFWVAWDDVIDGD